MRETFPRPGELWVVYTNHLETGVGLILEVENLGWDVILYKSLVDGEVYSLNHKHYLRRIDR